MKLFTLITVCLNETYSKGHIGKNMSDAFPYLNSLKKKKEMLYSHCSSTFHWNTP